MSMESRGNSLAVKPLDYEHLDEHWKIYKEDPEHLASVFELKPSLAITILLREGQLDEAEHLLNESEISNFEAGDLAASESGEITIEEVYTGERDQILEMLILSKAPDALFSMLPLVNQFSQEYRQTERGQKLIGAYTQALEHPWWEHLELP